MAAKLTRLTHKVEIQLHLVVENCTSLQFSLQAANLETCGYTLVQHRMVEGMWTILWFHPNISRSEAL
jgi:hypothetical protein